MPLAAKWPGGCSIDRKMPSRLWTIVDVYDTKVSQLIKNANN